VFSRFYFDRHVKGAVSLAEKYSGFKKSHGPPHWGYNPKFDDLENNEYLNRHNIDVEDTKFKGTKRVIRAIAAHGGHH
jgi:hypothetical protein